MAPTLPGLFSATLQGRLLRKEGPVGSFLCEILQALTSARGPEHPSGYGGQCGGHGGHRGGLDGQTTGSPSGREPSTWAITRRDVLKVGAAAGVVGAAGLVGATGGGLRPEHARLIDTALASSSSGGIGDIEHIVILMQENRSFDHYYGTMPGVRISATPRPTAPTPAARPPIPPACSRKPW